MSSIFGNRNLSMKLKIRLLKCYNPEVRVRHGLSADLIKNRITVEMWFLRIPSVSYLGRVANAECL